MLQHGSAEQWLWQEGLQHPGRRDPSPNAHHLSSSAIFAHGYAAQSAAPTTAQRNTHCHVWNTKTGMQPPPGAWLDCQSLLNSKHKSPLVYPEAAWSCYPQASNNVPTMFQTSDLVILLQLHDKACRVIGAIVTFLVEGKQPAASRRKVCLGDSPIRSNSLKSEAQQQDQRSRQGEAISWLMILISSLSRL